MIKTNQHLPVYTTRPGTFTNCLHEFLNYKALHRSDEEPALTKNDANSGSIEERFGPTCWEMMMLSGEILNVFHLAERFSVAVVGHASESSVWYGLEVSVSTEGRIMLMNFFVAVSLTPDFVRICWLWHDVLHSVLIDHLIIIQLI
jgi:hypothetical protein